MLEKNIIIDCDPGTDDALALLLASVYGKERVLCLVSTYGNVPVRYTHSNLEALADLLGMGDVPVLRGADCPMGKDCFSATDYHGGNGLLGITLCELTDAECESEGTEKLYEMIRVREKVIYVALGPLTNLALLLRRYPEAAEHIAEVIIMGGGIENGNTDSGAEYNFSLDPEAVSAVLEAPVKKTLALLDFTHTLAFSESEVRWMVGAEREALKGDNTLPYSVFGRIFYGNLDSALKNGNEGAIIHDGAAFGYLLWRDAYEASADTVCSDEEGRLFRSTKGHSVWVIDKMDRGIFAKGIKAAFYALRKGTESLEML